MKGKEKELQWSQKLTQEAVEFTFPEIMAKIVCTVDKEEYPHLTMIASNKAVNQEVMKSQSPCQILQMLC